MDGWMRMVAVLVDLESPVDPVYDCIEDTIDRDLKTKLAFLASWDAAMQALLAVVDMPDQRATLLLRLIHQNQGRLSKRNREQFPELTDEEIARMEAGIRASLDRERG